MNKNDIVEKVRGYLLENYNETFHQYLGESSVLLSGSTGWGIPEGSDINADWDLHVILDDDLHERYMSDFDPSCTIDDHSHHPSVFVQIRPLSWLKKRLDGIDTSVLYLWIYENGTWICDSLGIANLVEEHRKLFENNLENIAIKHFVNFSVRRLDASSSAKRGLKCATGIYRGSMVEAALRSFCIAKSSPYPYGKWLSKQTEILGEEGVSLVTLCEKCLFEQDVQKLPSLYKQLRIVMEGHMKEKFGESRWISHWWEYNEN